VEGCPACSGQSTEEHRSCWQAHSMLVKEKKRKEKKRKENKRKEKKTKEKKRKEKKTKEKKRKEKKRKEKKAPFGVSLTRSKLLYRADQEN